MYEGESVTIHFDPENPEESSLVEYSLRSQWDHTMMIFFSVMSAVAAVSLALVWSKRIPG
jgi:hypothetical protein